MSVAWAEMLDLEGSLIVEYLAGDSVSLDLQIRHLNNCYLKLMMGPILGSEGMTWAWTARLLAWASRLHRPVRATERSNASPRDR